MGRFDSLKKIDDLPIESVKQYKSDFDFSAYEINDDNFNVLFLHLMSEWLGACLQNKLREFESHLDVSYFNLIYYA